MPARSQDDPYAQGPQSASLLNNRRRDDGFRDRRDSNDDDTLSNTSSSWTDTGDIGEQLAEGDDPVRLQLSHDVEEELLAGVARRQPKIHSQKRVRIQGPSPGRHDRSRSRSRRIDKEAIEVPRFRKPRPSRTLRCLGFIMSGQQGSIHGLTGKALMCVDAAI